MAMHKLLASLAVLIVLCMLAEARLRASEGTVRVSIFAKDKKDVGGYLVRVLPTDSWEEFVGLANSRLQIASVCGVEDSNGQSVRGLQDVYDNDEIFFVACGSQSTSSNPAAGRVDSNPTANTVGSNLPPVGRPRIPSQLPQPLIRETPGSPQPLFSGGAAPSHPTAPRMPGSAAGSVPINPFAPAQPIHGQQFVQPLFQGQPHQSAQQVAPAQTGSPMSQEAMIRFVDVAKTKPVGIDWPADTYTGWGTYALQLILHMLRAQTHSAVILSQPDESILSYPMEPTVKTQLRSALQQLDTVQRVAEQNKQADYITVNFPVVHAVPPRFFSTTPPRFRGTKNIGLVMFEDVADIDEGALQRAKAGYDVLVTASQWNFKELAQHKDRLPPIINIIQGVDTNLFRPRVARNMFPGRYVIFSGGKVEYRKGQDLVIHAFKELLAQRPEIKPLLLVSWQNHWPQTMVGIEQTGHVRGLPRVGANGALEITEWLLSNGLPADSFHDLGMLSQEQIAEWLADADVAFFPNRGEGGTNLIAMQALASGIPTILSANSGHNDLIHLPMLKHIPITRTRHPENYGIRHCYPLWKHLTIVDKPHWGEPVVWEMVEVLERVHAELGGAAADKAATAVELMQHLSWDAQMRAVLELVDRVSYNA